MIFIKIGNYLPLFALLLFTHALPGQARQTNCDNPTAQADLKANAVRARITNGGDLWWDGSRSHYRVTVSGDETIDSLSTVFSAGLWMGGQRPDGNYVFAAQTYGRGGDNFDYYTGPLDDNGNHYGDCSDWDRMFPIYRTEIEGFFEMYDLTNPPTIDQVPINIAGWPGAGNPHFELIHGFSLPDNDLPLAPFYDQNEDGKYDPLAGDFPLFTGDQAIWCVFNDSGNIHRESNFFAKFQAEIQLLAYAFTSEDSVLNQTTYYEYKAYNRSQEQLNDFLIGHYVDVDLGCYTNDLVNSAPGHNLFYFYNNGATEDSCSSGLTPTRGISPVSILQVVEASADSEVDCDQDGTLMWAFKSFSLREPDEPSTDSLNTGITVETYHNFMLGVWGNGDPVTRGGFGHQTDGSVTRYMFDGGDYNGVPWLQCTSDIGVQDARSLYSTGPYDLAPGEVASFTLAVTNIFGVGYPDDSCPDTLAVFRAADRVKVVHDSTCAVLSSISGIVADPPDVVGREVFPNPTTGELTFRVPDNTEIRLVEIVDFSGRRITSYPGMGNEINIDLRASGLSYGIYFYRLRTAGGETMAGRVVLAE